MNITSTPSPSLSITFRATRRLLELLVHPNMHPAYTPTGARFTTTMAKEVCFGRGGGNGPDQPHKALGPTCSPQLPTGSHGAVDPPPSLSPHVDLNTRGLCVRRFQQHI